MLLTQPCDGATYETLSIFLAAMGDSDDFSTTLILCLLGRVSP
jgi:hypothetical protein